MILHFCKMKLIIISLIISVLSESSQTTGVDSNTCDPRGTWKILEDGRCSCKDLVTGDSCNQCTTGSFLLSSESQSGCRLCFCSAVSENCTSSNLNRDKIHMTDSELSASISLSAPYLGDLIITSRFVLGSNQRGISYADFPQNDSRSDYYWVLPPAFLGNLIASYGGNLTYKIQYATPRDSQKSGHAPDVILRSSNHPSLHHYFPQSPQPGSFQKFTVALLEEFWGESRYQFLNALINITAIEIRATYRMYTESTSLSDVSLDTATNSNNGLKKAVEVEECRCPIGYIGLSCEKCASGYTRPDIAGCYFGSCTRCKCNGHSAQCDPETGVCENCENHTTGKHCEFCEPGYERNAAKGDCISRQPEIVSETPDFCNCNPLGSKSNECADGACQCKLNVVGVNCDSCQSTTFGLSGDNVNGCNECFCSGVTKQCEESSLHIHPIIPDFYNGDHIFGLVDAKTESPVSYDNVQAFPFLSEIQYQYDPKTRGRQLMWSLSGIFTGNQVRSYGGYLKLSQKFTSRVLRGMTTSQKVTLKSTELTLSWRINVEFNHNNFVNFVIPLRESQWTKRFGDRSEIGSTRAELMMALSDLRAIIVFAPSNVGIDSIYISNVSLDTAVNDFPEGDRATQVEVCACPPGYSGTSCESCSPGYYRDRTERSTSVLGNCMACPCNNHEESCEMNDDAQVQCHCAAGYTGEHCQDTQSDEGDVVSLYVRVNPTVQLVQEGAVAEVTCIVSDRDRNVDLRWMKYGKDSLGPSAQQHGETLRITDVRVFDGGLYVCHADNGKTSSEAFALINVSPRTVPVLKVYPQDFQSVILGGSVSLQCRDISVECQTTAVQWTREDGRQFPPNVVQQSNGFLWITNITFDDDGTYQCSATNEAGTGTAVAQVEVVSIPVIAITPSIGGTVSVRLGENVTLACTADARPEPSVIWSRYTVATEYTSFPPETQNYAIHEITSMSKDDRGIYVCTATNSAGISEERIYVITDYAPLPPDNADAGIRISPDYLSIPVNKTVQMKCEVVGSDFRTIHLRWQRSNGLAIPSDRITDGLLTIPQVTKMDAGRYICLGLSSYGSESYRATSHLEVISLPRIILTPSNETVNLGATPSIYCIATGDGTITTKWTAIGQQLLPRNVEQDNGVLKFHRITGGHVGKYLCNATNEAGSVMQVAQVLFEPQECN